MTSPSTAPGNRKSVLWLLLAIGVCVYLIGIAAIEWQQYQWDFAVYYSAAHASRIGLDPYRLDDIQAFQKSTLFNRLDWLYPPLILRLFRPVTRIPYPVAVQLWLLIKVAAIAGLFAVWHRGFARIRLDLFSIAFFVLAFDACLPWDLTSGNASAIESLGVWIALLCWTRRRYLAFGLILAATAQTKFLPLAFSALLLFPPDGGRPRWKELAVTLVAFAAPVAFYAHRYPVWTHEFLHIAMTQDTPAPNNASLLVFLRDIASAIFGPIGLPPSLSRMLSATLYVGCAAAGLWATWNAIRRHRAVLPTPRTSPADGIPIVMLTVAAYALFAPRMICYSPVIVLLPAYLAIRALIEPSIDMSDCRFSGGASNLSLAVVALVLAFAPINLPPPLSHLFLFNYVRLAAIWLIWYLQMRTVGALTDAARTRVS